MIIFFLLDAESFGAFGVLFMDEKFFEKGVKNVLTC